MYVKEIIQKTKKKVFIKTEEGISFALYNNEAKMYDVAEGEEISDEDWSRILGTVLEPRAKRRAMHLLEKMDRTEAELLKKLKENGYPDEAAAGAVSYVKSFGYIDDRRYCGSYIRTYQDTRSRRRIISELSAKGIPDDIINQAMEEEYEADESGIISKLLKKERFDPRCSPKERARIYAKLLRKGFPPEITRKLMSGDVLE